MSQPAPDNTTPATMAGETPASSSWPDVLLLLAVCFTALYGLGSYGLYEPHEGHFAGVGREMLRHGDWLTPHLNGAPYLNKPPLFYWMIAASYAALGIHEWAARLPLALIGIAGVALLWHWGRQLWGLCAGRIAAAMLVVSVGWYLFSHQLLIDLLLSFLYLLSLYLLWKATLEPGRRRRWLAFYATVGLMIMAKGLVGVLFPGAVLLAFVLLRRDWGLLRQSRPLLGLLVILAISGPWVALLEWRNPGALEYMLVNEHVKRVVDTRWPPDYSVVQVSPHVYLLVALLWMMPWSILVAQVTAFARNAGAVPQSSRIAAATLPEDCRTPAVRNAVLVLALGALMPVLLFLPMPARLIYYSLPALAPYALLAAGWWSVADGESWSKSRRWAALSFMVLGAAMFSAGLWAPNLVDDLPQTDTAPALPQLVAGMAFLFGGALLAAGILLSLRRAALAVIVILALFSAASVYYTAGFKSYASVLSSKRLVAALRDKAGGDCLWISEGSKELGASAGIGYYLGQDSAGQPRTVLVMEDDDRRPPPKFPGPKPAYLIDHEQLAGLWESDRPALFVTDVQRTDWEQDAALLPEGEKHQVPLPFVSQRRVYANVAAWKRLSAGQ